MTLNKEYIQEILVLSRLMRTYYDRLNKLATSLEDSINLGIIDEATAQEKLNQETLEKIDEMIQKLSDLKTKIIQ